MTAGNVANTRFAFQAAKGTPAATSVYGVHLAGGGLVVGAGENAYYEETTGNQMRSDVYASERHGAGNPEILARTKAAAALLFAVLGADAVSGSEDPWTHAITHAPALPWITWWSHLGGSDFEEVSDTKVSQLVISGQSSQPLRMAMTVEGIRPRAQTSEETTAAIEVGPAPMFYDGDGALKLEGSAVASIGSFTCTISRNVTRVMGDGLRPIDLAEGLYTVEWQVGKLWASDDLRKRVLYGGGDPSNDADVVKTVLQLGSGGIDFKFTQVAASPGPARSIQLQSPVVTLAPYSTAPNTDGSPLREELALVALDNGSDEPLTATVANGMADLTP